MSQKPQITTLKSTLRSNNIGQACTFAHTYCKNDRFPFLYQKQPPAFMPFIVHIHILP